MERILRPKDTKMTSLNQHKATDKKQKDFAFDFYVSELVSDTTMH